MEAELSRLYAAAWPEFFSGLKTFMLCTCSGLAQPPGGADGARVAAVDLGDSIDVARRNVPDEVLTVQADLESLPFREASFDFVMSIGVLHHLPNTERALSYLIRFVAPGGRLRIYLYWQPERRWHRMILGVVAAARRVTTRLPHRLLLGALLPAGGPALGLLRRPLFAPQTGRLDQAAGRGTALENLRRLPVRSSRQ